ncbi:unannotated protein [freshwater metagenome]|uniref:Unannotated protein n=1 Tax=freshwater metagenome TaxID=449393 RepID=A0A6J7V4Y2_9ZZZZ|nr:hypothetical protein [Actinomycetota bacterium]MSX61977.1 hypothetical protein [Actinomycetota bacterium]MSZ68552.1 hypothetical protein [Actinomycetota bacterium]MTA67301.1 hypothetical protein [Actinomycetota bacterium]
MTAPKPSPSTTQATEGPVTSVLLTVIALALVIVCGWASQWQYHRGVDRHERNYLIASHVSLAPIKINQIGQNYKEVEWRQLSTTGEFDPSHQILLRNRYSEGKYGFDLLTLFHDQSGKSYWIDRGWIAPGATATDPPQLPRTSVTTVSIVGRLRLENSLPQGSFFAVSNEGSKKLISKWNAQSNTTVKTEKYYLDLISVSDATMNPKAPVVLPELTDGPHMAYALQWLFFAGLVIYGRFLLRRTR